MRSTVITTSLVLGLSGSTLAAGLFPREADAGLSLDKRGDCSCSCVGSCEKKCTAFGGTAGTQISQGMCLVTCEDSCGCGPTELCGEKIKKKLEKICREAEANAGDLDEGEKVALAMICTMAKA